MSEDSILFMTTLMSDVTATVNRLNTDNTEQNRRDVIRTAFAAIEGLNWQLRAEILDSSIRDKLTHHERAALSEETYIVTERGTVCSQPRFIPLASSIRLAVRIMQRVRPACKLDFNNEGWALLKQSINVRNRIVHPKKTNDLNVSLEETKNIYKAFSWFVGYVFEMIEQHKKYIIAENVVLQSMFDEHETMIALLKAINSNLRESTPTEPSEP